VLAYIQAHDKEKQIVGNTTVRGILDVENDIKKAISADTTLGANVIKSRIVNTVYGELEDYPVRSLAIEVDIWFRQRLSTRT